MEINKHITVLFIGLAGYFPCAYAAKPIVVTTQPLAQLARLQTYQAPAGVKILNQPQLAAEITGQVLHLPVRVGDRVTQGQVLAELDCRTYQQQAKVALAAVQGAQAKQALAQAQLKRAQNLKRKNSISDELWQQRRTELATARADTQTELAQQALAQLDAARCQLVAPFDAVVQARLASVGDLARPGMPLLKLVQLSGGEVSAMLRAEQYTTLQKAEPYFRYQGQNYPLLVRAMPPIIDATSRTREVRLMFSQAAAPLGAAGRLHWQGEAQLLPAELLIKRDSKLGVFVARKGQAVFVPLADAIEGQPAVANLAVDEQVVVEGRHNLQHGDALLVQQPGPGE